MELRENIKDISELGAIWPFIQTLKVCSFTNRKIINSPLVEEYIDKITGKLMSTQPETYIPYPEGIQIMIEPSSIEAIYPEAVFTNIDGTKYYRSELITALLVQGVKEVYEELSGRITKLEKK